MSIFGEHISNFMKITHEIPMGTYKSFAKIRCIAEDLDTAPYISPIYANNSHRIHIFVEVFMKFGNEY